MEKAKYITALWALLTSSITFSQIISGEEGKKTEEKQPEKELIEKAGDKKQRDLDNQTSLYFNSNWSNTYRKLTSSTDVFSKELGTRSEETSANFWSFGLGFRNTLSKHFQLCAGLGFVRNGEKYTFVGTDTSFNYQTTYRYISMPIVLNYTYGNEFKFFIGAGVIPQMALNYTQEQNWVNEKQVKSSQTIKLKGTDKSLNPFLLSAVVNTGIQIKYSNYWSLYVSPEIRFQLPNTYSKNFGLVHKATAIGFNIGLSYQL